MDTIYKVHIKDRKRVIRVRDIRIFKDYETKQATELPDYSKSPTFQGFFPKNNDNKETMEVPISRVGQKVNSKRDEEKEFPKPHAGQKIRARKEEYLASRVCKSQRFTTEHLSLSTTCINNAENESEGQDPRAGKKPMGVL